ncbi:MAG: hypothetical protein NTZ80_03000 [Patescibacteria group bacterium]|nr:hypothetical protein [Patescibacteria group bacterium]
MRKTSSAKKHGIENAIKTRPRSSKSKKRQKILLRMRTAEKLAAGVIVR